MKSTLVNLVAYQIGWLACVLGAAGGWASTGAAVALLLALGHLALAERPRREWPLLAAAAGFGLVVDTASAGLGVLDFRGHRAGTLAPLWIVALWLQFGTLLHFSLGWLSHRYLLAAALGAIGGPLAFVAGEQLGAATLGEPRLFSLSALALAWAVALPLLVGIADRLGGPGSYRIFAAESAGGELNGGFPLGG